MLHEIRHRSQDLHHKPLFKTVFFKVKIFAKRLKNHAVLTRFSSELKKDEFKNVGKKLIVQFSFYFFSKGLRKPFLPCK